MSNLRSSFLEQLRIIGNHSGCHQLPERSFFLNGKQFPVCARCTGVTIGQTLAVIYFFITKNAKIGLSIFLLGIMGLDWGLQEFKIKSSTNVRRLITGVCGGFGIILFYIWGFQKIVKFFKYVMKAT